MDESFERRALLMHLGDVLESLACASRVARVFDTLGTAIVGDETLADFWFLSVLNKNLTINEFCTKAANAFFLWPKLLLEAELNRDLLADLVRTNLFPDNEPGWTAYVTEMHKEAPWFGNAA